MAKFVKGQSGNPAGKPKGATNLRTRRGVEVMAEHGVDPIAGLCRELKSLTRPLLDRKARIGIYQLLLPYAYPRLGLVKFESDATRDELEHEIDRELARLAALQETGQPRH